MDNHPIIPNTNQYILYKKYISIHSEDRDIKKYPNSSQFEIELPDDLLNICSIKLVNWSFPSNYDMFSHKRQNTRLLFTIPSPFNPADISLNTYDYQYEYDIFYGLLESQTFIFQCFIEEGFYNPEQLCNELTNKMNYTITEYLKQYFTNTNKTSSLNTINQFGYTRFKIVFNSISSKVWFGNQADQFYLLSDEEMRSCEGSIIVDCIYPNYKDNINNPNTRLPRCLGILFNETENKISSIHNIDDIPFSSSIAKYHNQYVPRFYYGDVLSGDDGYWLLPIEYFTIQKETNVYWIEPAAKINILGESYFYMELSGYNCIDETKEYEINMTNLRQLSQVGSKNSSFAKIPIPCIPLSQWYDRDSYPYFYSSPPLERIRRLAFRFRYHDGSLVNFNYFNFSFLLEFSLQAATILRNTNTHRYPI